VNNLPIVHVVDDDPMFRTAIARLLRTAGYETTLYDSSDKFLKTSPSEGSGCILLDVRMADLDGLELQRRLTQSGCLLPIVFLTGFGDLPTSVKAIKAGAEDFLSKPISRKILLDAIERALARNRDLRSERERIEGLRVRISTLTPRENQVFALVVRGKLNKQIAAELGTSERTVKAHRQGVMKKLGVTSVAGAVSIAERLGLLS